MTEYQTENADQRDAGAFGESPVRGRPIPAAVAATWAIIFANIAVFVAITLAGGDVFKGDAQLMVRWGANFGPRTLDGQWWRLVTCMFLHFGIIHLALNMWIFLGLARLTELWVGSTGFAIAYFVSGIAGSITSVAWNPQSISAGASGAVFGTAGTLLGFVVLRSDTIPSTVRNQMLKSMGYFLLLNTILGLSVSQIDMAAHTGGFVGGFLCGLLLSQPVSPGMQVRRSFRNLLTGICSAVVLGIAILALPPAPPDIGAALREREVRENQLHDEYNALVNLNIRGDIENGELAERLRRDILPPWAECRKNTEAMLSLKQVNHAYLQSLVDYMRVREEGWQLLADAIQEGDLSKAEQASVKSKEADRMISERSEVWW